MDTGQYIFWPSIIYSTVQASLYSLHPPPTFPSPNWTVKMQMHFWGHHAHCNTPNAFKVLVYSEIQHSIKQFLLSSFIPVLTFVYHFAGGVGGGRMGLWFSRGGLRPPKTHPPLPRVCQCWLSIRLFVLYYQILLYRYCKWTRGCDICWQIYVDQNQCCGAGPFSVVSGLWLQMYKLA